MKPTEEQVKEFWEWCGIKAKLNLGELIDSEGEVYEYPKLDINNLFKYAVPKLHKMGIQVEMCSSALSNDFLFRLYNKNGKVISYQHIENPTLALFWAIWKVKK